MRRTLALVSLTASAIATAAALSASPAAATPTPGLADCPAYSLCGWNGPSFTGAMATFTAGCTNSFPIRSIANTYPSGGIGIPFAMAVYSDPDCTGTLLGWADRGESVASLPAPGASVQVAE